MVALSYITIYPNNIYDDADVTPFTPLASVVASSLHVDTMPLGKRDCRILGLGRDRSAVFSHSFLSNKHRTVCVLGDKLVHL